MEVYMFEKWSARPALAYAAQDKPATVVNKKKAPFTYSAANEAEDFNAFGSGSGAKDARQRKEAQGAPRGKANAPTISRKTLLVAGAAVVAFILLMILVITLFMSGTKDIKLQDNTFIVYDDGGLYKVAVNGYAQSTTFDTRVDLDIAGDNSFAYVTEEISGTYNLFVLEGKTIRQLNENPLEEILAKAEFGVAAVWKEEGVFYLYRNGEKQTITKDVTARNFVLSPDGRFLLYNEDMPDSSYTKLLRFDAEGGQPDILYKNNIPVAISNDGKYVYSSAMAGDQSSLNLNVYVKDKIKVENSQNFNKLIYMNVTGNEILFTTDDGTTNATYFYKFGDESATKIGFGEIYPVTEQSKIALLKTLKHTVLLTSGSDAFDNTRATFFIDKKYGITKLANYPGKVDPQGKYCYFINNSRNLIYKELKSGNGESLQLAKEVSTFEITAEGNIYFIDVNGTLFFHKKTWTKPDKIKDDIRDDMVLHRSSNTLYFLEIDGLTTYSSKEGSDAKAVQWAKYQLESIPMFSNPVSNKTYVTVYDTQDQSYKVFYTSNGKDFKLTSQFCTVVYSDREFTEPLQEG